MSATAIAPADRINPFLSLGEDVSGLTKIDEILAAGGADFTAYTRPSGSHPMNGPADADGNPTEGDFAPDGGLNVYRDDSHEVIGRHGDGYVTVPYKGIVELAFEAVGLSQGSSLAAVGVGANGGTFYACIDLGDLILDPGGINDVINRFLVIWSSHNGKLPVALIPSNNRKPCTNTIPPAYGRDGSFAAKHTKNIGDKLAIARDALGIAQAAHARFVEDAEKMMRTPSSQVTLERTIEKLYPLAPGAGDKARTQHATRKSRIIDIYNSDTCVGGVGHTMWAQYNAIGEYLDHGRGTSADKRAAASILPSGWVTKDKGKALALCLN